MCLPGRAASIGATFLSATGKTKPAVALRRAGYSFRSMISSENRFHFSGSCSIQFCDDDLIALICRTSKIIFL